MQTTVKMLASLNMKRRKNGKFKAFQESCTETAMIFHLVVGRDARDLSRNNPKLAQFDVIHHARLWNC